jgi:hypothetical protein
MNRFTWLQLGERRVSGHHSKRASHAEIKKKRLPEPLSDADEKQKAHVG